MYTVTRGGSEAGPVCLKRSRLVRAAAIAGVILSVCSLASAGNLLVNPGFETGSMSGWWSYGNCSQESWAWRTGTNGMVFQSWTPGGWGGFGQDVAVSVSAGDVLTFNIWGLAETNFRSSASEAWLKIEYWTNGASAWTRQDTLSIYGGLIARPNQWNVYSFVATNVLPNVNLVKVLVGGGNFVGGGTAAVKWDDAEFSVASGSGNFPVSGTATGNAFRIGWTATTTVYYQVWSSAKLDGTWELIRGMTLGTNGSLVWQDASAVGTFTSMYYKIVAISVTNSHDQDGDGLSDVAELRGGGSDPMRSDTDGDQINDGIDPRPAVSNVAPVIQPLTLQSTGNFHNGSAILTTVSGSDADGDAIQYRLSAGGGPFTSWQTGNQFSWTPAAQDVGVRVMTVEARDAWGATGTRAQSVYVFRMPPQP